MPIEPLADFMLAAFTAAAIVQGWEAAFSAAVAGPDACRA